MSEYAYEGVRRVQYPGGATFVPVCPTCHRFVLADLMIVFDSAGPVVETTATCSRCGRVAMPFEGYL